MNKLLCGSTVSFHELFAVTTMLSQRKNGFRFVRQTLLAVADVIAQVSQRLAELFLISVPFFASANSINVFLVEVNVTNGVASFA